MTIGETIRSIRIAKGLTQGECARRLRIDQTRWSQYEIKPQPFRKHTLVAIAQALETHPEDLLRVAGIPMTEPVSEHDRLLRLGLRVCEIRTTCGLTQEELAQRIGVSKEAIRQYEDGRTEPTALRMEQIAAALDVTPNDLYHTPRRPDPQNRFVRVSDLRELELRLDVRSLMERLDALCETIQNTVDTRLPERVGTPD